MAIVTITEYEFMAKDAKGFHIPAGQEPAITIQTVDYTTPSQSAALNSRTHFVRIKSDTAGYLKFGDNPTASSSDTPFAADQPEFFGVNPNQTIKIGFHA